MSKRGALELLQKCVTLQLDQLSNSVWIRGIWNSNFWIFKIFNNKIHKADHTCGLPKMQILNILGIKLKKLFGI